MPDIDTIGSPVSSVLAGSTCAEQAWHKSQDDGNGVGLGVGAGVGVGMLGPRMPVGVAEAVLGPGGAVDGLSVPVWLMTVTMQVARMSPTRAVTGVSPCAF